MRAYKQSFYNPKFCAFEIVNRLDISDSGVVKPVNLLVFSPISKNPSFKFDFENQLVTKISIDELCMFRQVMIAFREKGKEGYERLAKAFTPGQSNDQGSQLEFIHKIVRKECELKTIIALNFYNNKLQFRIHQTRTEVNQSKQGLIFPIPISSFLTIENYLAFIINRNFLEGYYRKQE